MVRLIIFILAFQFTSLFGQGNTASISKRCEIAFRFGFSSFPKYSENKYSNKSNYFNILNGISIYSWHKSPIGLELNNFYSVSNHDSNRILTNQNQVIGGLKIKLFKLLDIEHTSLSIGLAINRTILKLTNTNINSTSKYKSSIGYSLPVSFCFPEFLNKKYRVTVSIGYFFPLKKSTISNMTEIKNNQFVFSCYFPLTKI